MYTDLHNLRDWGVFPVNQHMSLSSQRALLGLVLDMSWLLFGLSALKIKLLEQSGTTISNCPNTRKVWSYNTLGIPHQNDNKATKHFKNTVIVTADLYKLLHCFLKGFKKNSSE